MDKELWYHGWYGCDSNRVHGVDHPKIIHAGHGIRDNEWCHWCKFKAPVISVTACSTSPRPYQCPRLLMRRPTTHEPSIYSSSISIIHLTTGFAMATDVVLGALQMYTEKVRIATNRAASSQALSMWISYSTGRDASVAQRIRMHGENRHPSRGPGDNTRVCSKSESAARP